MKKCIETIIKEYKEEVDIFNEREKTRRIKNDADLVKCIFDAINMLYTQNDTIIKLLVSEREKENEK